MVYILADDGRQEDVVRAFRKYRQYLDSVRAGFPKGAYGLATSDWWFDPRDFRCPHDAWLESATVIEVGEGERKERRSLSLVVRLLGAYHDGHIELHYPQIFSYSFVVNDGVRGHVDWRYDEMRLSERGHLLHEIEWCHSRETGRWIIEASDLEFSWIPQG